MLEINNNKILKLKDNIFLQKIEELEKYRAFNIDNGDYYTLNETSFWILELILKPKSIKELFELFLSSYEIETQIAKKDFLEILNNFYSNNLIEGGKKDERNKKEAL